MNLARLFAFVTVTFALCAQGTYAAPKSKPIAPGRAQMKGDIVRMNQQFHLYYYNFRILKVRWLPYTSTLGQALVNNGIGADTSITTNGVLVITAAVKATGSEPQDTPEPEIQAIYKDGTQSDWPDMSGRDAYDARGQQISGQIDPGEGRTVLYAISGLPQPTTDNPITKIMFRPFKGFKNDAGAPNTFRLLNPAVEIAP